MDNLAKWFTADRRQAIQIFLGTLAPLAIMFGFGTEGIWEQSLIIAGAALQFLASLLSLVNLRGVMEIWTVLRGAIYTFGTVVSPALVLLGFFDEATNALILTGTSLALGALSNLLAIFTAGDQKQTEKIEAAFQQGVEAAQG